MILKYTSEEFLNGNLDNLNIIDSRLVLNEDALIGTYKSPIINTDMFDKLVASWNSNTNEYSSVEFFIRVKTNIWSKWFSYGKWSDLGRNEGSIENQKDEVAEMYIDELNVFSKCDTFQFKIVLRRTSLYIISPVVIRAFVTINKEFSNEEVHLSNVDIEVPKLSQMEVLDIGSIICSPTAVSMVTNYYGKCFIPSEVSEGCFDNGAGIYGNWSYNVSYASERGFIGYVDYCHSTLDLLRYIQRGIPVIASIKTKSKDVIEGAPQAYPQGHLVVVRGFLRDGEDYIIVNDPASVIEKDVKRYYKLNEFLKAWNHVVCIIKPSR